MSYKTPFCLRDRQLLERITINPNICHGKPCLRELRYPVEFILELLSSGMTIEEILEDYDDFSLVGCVKLENVG